MLEVKPAGQRGCTAIETGESISFPRHRGDTWCALVQSSVRFNRSVFPRMIACMGSRRPYTGLTVSASIAAITSIYAKRACRPCV